MGNNNSFSFLTTKPQRRLLSKLHPEWLYVLPKVTMTTERLVADVTYTDGTTTSYTLIDTEALTLRAGEVKYFDVSYAKRNYDNMNPAKTIKYITIKITSSQGFGDFVTYFPYTPNGDDIKAIYYHNSQGGVDSLICESDIQESRSFDGLVTASPMESVYDTNAAQFKYVDPSFRSEFSLSSGQKPAKEIFALHDLFSIKRAYEYEEIAGGKLLTPIIPEQRDITFPSARTNIRQLSFTYRYAFDQRAIDRIS